jgi:hypothetical protein
MAKKQVIICKRPTQEPCEVRQLCYRCKEKANGKEERQNLPNGREAAGTRPIAVTTDRQPQSQLHGQYQDHRREVPLAPTVPDSSQARASGQGLAKGEAPNPSWGFDSIRE